jgi:hypothetical protein
MREAQSGPINTSFVQVVREPSNKRGYGSGLDAAHRPGNGWWWVEALALAAYVSALVISRPAFPA